jgi:alcohol dehydrogenase, propanol-preferring
VSGVPVTVAGFPFDRAQTLATSVIGTRAQMREVLGIAAAGRVRTVVDRFPMSEAEQVLERLAAGGLRSRAVLENAPAAG